MPQDSIFPEAPTYDSVSITFQEVPGEGGQTWNLVVRRGRRGGGPETVHASRVSGYMVDFVATFASEAASSFFFGDDRDLARAMASVAKAARAHQRRHERVG